MFFALRLLESLLVILTKILLIVTPMLPESWVFSFCDNLAKISWYLARDARATSLRTLKVISPSLSSVESRKIVEEHFAHQYKNFVEILCYSRLTSQRIQGGKVKFEGMIHVEKALRHGKGILLAVPHFGNWEMLGASLSLLGYDLHSFFLEMRFARLSELLNQQRRKTGIKLISRHELKKSVKVLKNNGILGVIADQDGGAAGIALPFFGQKVSFPIGLARLQKITGATVLYNVIERNADNTYTFHVYRALAMENSMDKHRDQILNSWRVLQCYERDIQRNPAQWLLSYDRFKQRTHVDELPDDYLAFPEITNGKL
jgi:KDO2-lipid IV(A) lauroyltransferase